LGDIRQKPDQPTADELIWGYEKIEEVNADERRKRAEYWIKDVTLFRYA
jgi:hypothetical protein